VKKTQELGEDGEELEEEEEPVSDEINLYVDQRDQIYGGDGAEEEEEEEVVEIPQEGQKKKQARTEKICRFFLDAVEKKLYGWRWVCPNGMECMYQHKLPMGYVFKDGGGLVAEDTTPLEEKLEGERALLTGGTPVTLARFIQWK